MLVCVCYVKKHATILKALKTLYLQHMLPYKLLVLVVELLICPLQLLIVLHQAVVVIADWRGFPVFKFRPAVLAVGAAAIGALGATISSQG